MFSIVIPLYNKDYRVIKTLNSIINQTYLGPFEIIIVNDGSSDGSLEIVKEYFKNKSDIDYTIIDQVNQGVSVARNNGIEKAKYNWICLLDADDELINNALSIYYKLIQDFSKVYFFCGGFTINGKLRETNLDSGYVKDFFLESRKFSFVNTSCTCIKKDLLLKFPFPEGEKAGEDLYVWARIAENFQIVYTREIVADRFHEEDNSRSGRDNVIPYILKYYSENKTRNKSLISYLKYVYFVHLADVASKLRYAAWYNRWKIGLKLFPGFSIFSIPFTFLPIGLLRKIKIKKNEKA